jgi:hypothetical protein
MNQGRKGADTWALLVFHFVKTEPMNRESFTRRDFMKLAGLDCIVLATGCASTMGSSRAAAGDDSYFVELAEKLPERIG